MKNNLSEIIIQMVGTILNGSPRSLPFETVHAGLLMAQVAWNREVNNDYDAENEYLSLIKKLESSHKSLMDAFIFQDSELLINSMRKFKRVNYSNDKRFITFCGYDKTGKLKVTSE